MSQVQIIPNRDGPAPPTKDGGGVADNSAKAVSFDPYAMPADALLEPPATLWAALRKIGPGIVLAGSIIGSGELLLTTALGAQYGFLFLWLILFSCVIKVFVQVELGRYAISSGKPTLGAINELPGPRLGGAHWLAWWWLIMMLASVAQLGAMAGGVGQALHLAFPGASPGLANLLSGATPALSRTIAARPECPWAVLTAVAAVLLLLSGGYRRIELITTAMVAGVTAITVLCVAALPATGFPIRPADVVGGLTPDLFNLPPAAIAAAFATFGLTGVGATELYAYPYWCLEKGYARFAGPRDDSEAWARRARGWVRVMNLDAWVSMIVFTVATVCFYCLGATVLHRQQLNPKGTDMIATLAQMYVPMFGTWTKALFLAGVWAVLFKTLYVATAGHSRMTADFLKLARFVDYPEPHARQRWIRRLCIAFPLGALGLYLVFGEPKAMVIFGGFFQGITLPVIAGIAVYFRYKRCDRRLTPSRASGLWLWAAFGSITVVAVYATWERVRNQILPGVMALF